MTIRLIQLSLDTAASREILNVMNIQLASRFQDSCLSWNEVSDMQLLDVRNWVFVASNSEIMTKHTTRVASNSLDIFTYAKSSLQ
jgi:hypothetical protein